MPLLADPGLTAEFNANEAGLAGLVLASPDVRIGAIRFAIAPYGCHSLHGRWWVTALRA